MTTVIVYVRGGVVQDIDVDSEDVRIMVIDYDNEADPEFCGPRGFFPDTYTPERVAKALAGTEED
jgi:hypothetical protein